MAGTWSGVAEGNDSGSRFNIRVELDPQTDGRIYAQDPRRGNFALVGYVHASEQGGRISWTSNEACALEGRIQREEIIGTCVFPERFGIKSIAMAVTLGRSQ
jgi:hypothetical protein